MKPSFPPSTRTFTKQREALSWKGDNGVAWSFPVTERGGGRMYAVDTLDSLMGAFLADPVKTHEETIEVHRPARLFFDLDAKNVSRDELFANAEELMGCVFDGLLQEYGLLTPPFTALDASRAEKASLHLIVDVWFANMREMHWFVRGIPAELTGFVDMQVYTRNVGQLRLPMARKFDAGSISLLPVDLLASRAKDFVLEKALVRGRTGELLPKRLKVSMPLVMGGSGADPLSSRELEMIENIFDWYRLRVRPKVDGKRVDFVMERFICENLGRAHESNHIYLHVTFKKDRIVHANFSCSDAACTGYSWDADLDVAHDPQAFVTRITSALAPSRERVLLDAHIAERRAKARTCDGARRLASTVHGGPGGGPDHGRGQAAHSKVSGETGKASG